MSISKIKNNMEVSQGIILSFIIPVFNSKNYLKECIDSILAFPSDRIEIILVDDGSTDGSGTICDAYGAKNKNMKVVHQQNGGVASARNRGIQESSGDYLFFVDNDDMVNGEKLGDLLDTLTLKQPDIVLNRYVIIGDDEKKTKGNAFIDSNAINNKKTEDVLTYFRTSRINILAPWEYVIRKEVITENKLAFDSDQDGVDDSCFSPILFCHCSSFYIGDDTMYFWRQRQDSQGRSHNKRSYIVKMISTIDTLDEYRKKNSAEFIADYMLFCIYKNAYSLLGQYYSYAIEDRLFLDTWYYEQKSLLHTAAERSGIVHKLLNTFFGGLQGIILSYKLAVLKGFIYSYLYGHSSRTTKEFQEIQ
jgi:glycosyltransferase involved in cell wall biosynthesis